MLIKRVRMKCDGDTFRVMVAASGRSAPDSVGVGIRWWPEVAEIWPLKAQRGNGCWYARPFDGLLK